MFEAKQRVTDRPRGGRWNGSALVPPFITLILACLFVLAVSGCTTILREDAQFKPAPREQVQSAQELDVAPPIQIPSSMQGEHAYSRISIPDPLPERVVAEIRELQNDYSPTFQRGLDRASKYEGPIRDRLRAAGLPEELIWMAMVESMFQTKVNSPAGAGGMWQFIPSTARRYQLRIDRYVDERYDWERCTEAAIQYLKDLHDFFEGRWDLAITAYNMGEGGLQRCINANGGTQDFWTLIETPPACNRIRQESKKYYPRLLAYSIVNQAPEKYGFTRGTETPDDVEHITVQGMYSLAKLDAALECAPGTLEGLNPDLVRDVTPPTGEYRVAVPRSKTEQFLVALKTVTPSGPSSDDQMMASGKYRVRKGDSVAKIAAKYGVETQAILKANRLKTAKSLRVGQTLTIPGVDVAKGGPTAESSPSKAADQTSAKTAKSSEAPAPVKPKTYTVKKGDTLGKIASRNGITVAKLQELNKIGKNGVINVGQTLSLGGGAAAPVEPVNENVRYHTVAPGEFVAAIGSLYGTTPDDIFRWNNLDKNAMIRPGDKLIVAVNPEKPSASTKSAKKNSGTEAKETVGKAVTEPTAGKHKVSKGESLGVIAQKYGMKQSELAALNKLSSKSVLKVGQELAVRKPTAGSAATAEDDETVKMAKATKESGSTKTAQTDKAQEEKVVHTVAAGDTPAKIAKKHGVPVDKLFRWNSWSKTPVLQIGASVVVYKNH